MIQDMKNKKIPRKKKINQDTSWTFPGFLRKKDKKPKNMKKEQLQQQESRNNLLVYSQKPHSSTNYIYQF